MLGDVVAEQSVAVEDELEHLRTVDASRIACRTRTSLNGATSTRIVNGVCRRRSRSRSGRARRLLIVGIEAADSAFTTSGGAAGQGVHLGRLVAKSVMTTSSK